ncbi:MAG TPA: hypothetical protein VJS64_10790 [Pyrinomonadaceae bacterium]|nr:hypothetical protein [Pyrinomonadaceae bacterium]
MFDELLTRITSIDYEDYGSLQVNAVEWRNGDVLLFLDVIADDEPDIPKNVLITARSFRESNLAPGSYAHLDVSKDHVLLWHYIQPYFLTSFYGKSAERLAVVGALFERHVDLVGDWIPFRRYLNSEVRLSELIGGSFGMLADGPEPLIAAYEEVMQCYGFSTSRHKSNRPRDAMLSVMIFDESYVIAEDFRVSAL